MNREIKTLISGAMMIAVIASGCSVSADSLPSGSWVLVSIDGKPVAANAAALEFSIEGDNITGFDGCNRFGGSLSDAASINSTQRECIGNYLKLPIDMSDPKAHLESGTLDGDLLVLPARAGHPASMFT